MANVHPIKVTACLNPECRAKPPLAARGLCLPCYNQARAAIRRNETTWAKLEELGVARPRNFAPLRCSANWLSQTPEYRRLHYPPRGSRHRREARAAAEQSAKKLGRQPPS